MGNLFELGFVQKGIKQEIRRAKLCYKQKVENKLSNNNLGRVRKKVTLDYFIACGAVKYSKHSGKRFLSWFQNYQKVLFLFKL